MRIEKPVTRKTTKLSVLIYSLTGGGKTRFCGTAQLCEETSPTLLVDIGGGSNTVASMDIDVTRPTSLAEFQDMYSFLREDNTKYRSVCLDGITGTQQELSMPEVSGAREQGVADDYSSLADTMPPALRDYLKSHTQVRRIFRAFRDLCLLRDKKRRIHVFVTALEKKDDARNILCPQLPGVLGTECGAYFDILARLTIKTTMKDDVEVERRHLLMSERTDDEGMVQLAKTRWLELGRYMWSPTVGKLMAKWTSLK